MGDKIFDPSKYQAFLNTLPPYYNKADSRDKKRLYEDAGEVVQNALIAHKAIISGGSVLKVYSGATNEVWGKPDIDIYVHQKHAVGLVTALNNMCKFDRKRSFASSAYCDSFFRKNHILVRLAGSIGNRDVDIMIVDNTRPLRSVVTNFDLTFCEIWYDGKTIHASNSDHVAKKHGFLRKEYHEVLFKENNHFIKSRIQKYSKRGFIIEVAKMKQPIRLHFRKAKHYIHASDEESLVKLMIKLLVLNDNSELDLNNYGFELMKFLCGFKKFTAEELNNSIIQHISKDVFMKTLRFNSNTEIIAPKAIYAYLVENIYNTDYIKECYRDELMSFLQVIPSDMRSLDNIGNRTFMRNNMIVVKPPKVVVPKVVATPNLRFDVLYSNYKLLSGNKTINDEAGSKAFLALSKDLRDQQTMDVLAPPMYDRIRNVRLTDSQIDVSGTYVTNKGDDTAAPMLAVTPEFIKWFVSIIDKLRKKKNNADNVDQLSELPRDIQKQITNQLPYTAYSALRATATAFRTDARQHPYFAANHPKFIKAFATVLQKYSKSIETEAKILAEYKVHYDEYMRKPEIEYIDETDEETNNEINANYHNLYTRRYEHNTKMIRHITIMYIKLLIVSNFNPKYILDLIGMYKKKYDIPYMDTFTSKEKYASDKMIQYELYKVYIQMHFLNLVDNRIELTKAISHITGKPPEYISVDAKTALYTKYILTYLYSLQIDDPSNINWQIKHTFDELKKDYATAPQNLLINFPSEIKTVYDLRTQPIGLTNYQNCVDYILKNKAAITKYTKYGLALKMAFLN